MANPGLDHQAQLDFAAGMVRSVARHLIPPNGAYDIVNGLLDDDGSVYRRGGSVYKSDAGLGSAGLRFIWDGQLLPGARTLIASAAKWGVLDSNDTTIVDLGAGGVADPCRGVVVDQLLFIDGGTIYGGSRKAADYSTGTVTTTAGSKTVTGAGTAFLANVDAGMLFRISGERVYVVASVDSNTQITLKDAYTGSTGGGKAYTLKRFETATAPYRTASLYATVAGRLVTFEGNEIHFSNTTLGGGLGPHVFTATDFHALPTGVTLLGGEAVRDVLLAYSTGGVWALSGLLNDLVDDFGNIQQRLDRINGDLILWSDAGIATWRGQLVVPAVDGLWLMGSVGAPVRLSGSITPLWVSYVRAGYKCGQAAVYRNHYMVPVLDSSNVLVDFLVCRLDRPTSAGGIGTVYPWTRWSGHAANITGLAVRTAAGASRNPAVLAASKAAGSRILDLSRTFEPAAAYKNDADATTHERLIETRDYATGSLNVNHTRRIRLRHESVDGGSDNPTIQGYYNVGEAAPGGSEWGSAHWGVDSWSDSSGWILMTGNAPEDDGRTPFVWHVNKKSRYIRFRFRSDSPFASSTFRSIERFTRLSARP